MHKSNLNASFSLNTSFYNFHYLLLYYSLWYTQACAFHIWPFQDFTAIENVFVINYFPLTAMLNYLTYQVSISRIRSLSRFKTMEICVFTHQYQDSLNYFQTKGSYIELYRSKYGNVKLYGKTNFALRLKSQSKYKVTQTCYRAQKSLLSELWDWALL